MTGSHGFHLPTHHLPLHSHRQPAHWLPQVALLFGSQQLGCPPNSPHPPMLHDFIYAMQLVLGLYQKKEVEALQIQHTHAQSLGMMVVQPYHSHCRTAKVVA